MAISAIDPGNFDTKFFDGKTAKKFPSALGGWKERNLAEKMGNTDIEYEFLGKKGFAGTLAQSESYNSSRKGESKVHEEVLLRILLALFLYGDDDEEHQIVVGQPIISHTEAEKKAYKEMVEKKHEIKVNGKTRTITIKECRIAAEGVAVGLLPPNEHGTVRVIDVGSGTVNFATLRGRKPINAESDTFPKGAENVKESDDEFARLIHNFAMDLWRNYSSSDKIRLCGAAAKKVYPHLQKLFPQAELMDDPAYSNVKAFYELAVKFYG